MYCVPCDPNNVRLNCRFYPHPRLHKPHHTQRHEFFSGPHARIWAQRQHSTQLQTKASTQQAQRTGSLQGTRPLAGSPYHGTLCYCPPTCTQLASLIRIEWMQFGRTRDLGGLLRCRLRDQQGMMRGKVHLLQKWVHRDLPRWRGGDGSILRGLCVRLSGSRRGGTLMRMPQLRSGRVFPLGVAKTWRQKLWIPISCITLIYDFL